MKKPIFLLCFFLSNSVLAHNSLNNDFESIIKSMFNRMEIMNMHQSHLFKEIGLKQNNDSWLFLNQSENEMSIQLKIALNGMEKDDLKIHIDKNLLIIKAEKTSISETSQSSQSFMQQFLIPKNTDKSKITAEIIEDELVINIPKNINFKSEIQQILIN